MRQVFISYSRKDLKFVEQLAADLQKAGFDVWYDVSGISGGSRWRAEIESGIRNSQFQIVVLSPDSIASEWVEREFLFGSRLNRKIIPLMYRTCELPLNYLDLNYIDVIGDNYQRNFPKILRALGKGTDAPFSPGERKVELAHAPVNSRGNVMSILPIFIGGVVILFLLVSSYLLIQWLQQATPSATEPVVVIPDTLTPEPPSATPVGDFIDNFGVQMVLIPAGEFLMGSANGDGDEKPVHTVHIDSYYIDKYEVTVALYQDCMNAGVCPGSFSEDYYNKKKDHPVADIDWSGANAYCAWRDARLPTEAEWEKAARGADERTYPWGETISCANANFEGCVGDTTPVGSYESGKSIYGVYDMAGNVWEWVADFYQDDYYLTSENITNPTGPRYSDFRILRGGSWFNNSYELRTSHRFDVWLDSFMSGGTGFRCAKTASP